MVVIITKLISHIIGGGWSILSILPCAFGFRGELREDDEGALF